MKHSNKTIILLVVSIITSFAINLSCQKKFLCPDCDNNKPPVAHAGKDTTIILPVDSVTLDGSASTDDKKIVSYQWTKISGPSSFNIVNVNAVQTQVSNLTEGTYQFELKVTDGGGLFSKDTVQVMVLTGQQGCDTQNRATITIQLVPVAAIPTTRYGTTTATAGNKLLLAGGITDNSGNSYSSNVDIYDFGAQTWSTAHLSTARLAEAVTVGNKIFFVGGVGSGFYGTTRVDIYDASTNTWSLSDLPSPASTVYSYALVGNKVFFATGGNPGVYGGKVDVYDTSTGLWSEIDLPEQVQFVTATTVGNKVYFAGGLVNPPANNLLSVVNIYDNATGTWSTTSSLSQPTWGMGSIYVNGKIYWAGGAIGYDAVKDKVIPTCKVEIRDVSTGSSSFTNLSAPGGFDGNSKPIYYNSKIIFPGWRGDTYLYLDIYDPQSSTWSIGQLQLPQNEFIESVILVNNALYAIGGNPNYANQIWKLQY